MPSGLKRIYIQILKGSLPMLLFWIAWSCATVVAPTGGPKDVTPPKVVFSQPSNRAVNFKGRKIIINFDEYVSLKTPEKYLLISPPMGKPPDIKLKGHSVIINIKDSLRDNTTYNFYLGEAIVDLTENNPIPNFNFAFSTGPDIDSLSLMGNIMDAFTRMPVKAALVMLYSDFTDTVPKTQIPKYVSRTGEDGHFRLNNLASGKYRAIALVDANSDYMYNMPNETVGFYSDTVSPYYSPETIKDTNAVIPDAAKQMLVSIDMFTEPDSTQRVLKSTITAANRLLIAFRYGTTAPTFRPLNIGDSLPWAVTEWNKTHDSISAWLLNKPDTLKLEITDHGAIIDTIKISTTLKSTGRGKNNKKPILSFISNTNGGKLGYDVPFMLTFSNPVSRFNTDSVILTVYSKTDTTKTHPSFRFTDSIQRHMLVNYKWNDQDRYDLFFPKGSFTDIYSDSCDSTHIAFHMLPVDEYGRFAVTLNRIDQSHPVIVQLLNEKGLALSERYVTKENRVDFGLLPPGKYGLKTIMDVNGNGKWDTGIFLKKIQPERVLVHPKVFEVRTNWELEETWDL